VVGLAGIELFKELGGEGGIFSDEHEGFGRGRGWRVDRRVGISGHSLPVVDAQGVVGEGGMGLVVFERLGVLLRLSPLGLLSGSGWFEGVVVQVPHRQG